MDKKFLRRSFLVILLFIIVDIIFSVTAIKKFQHINISQDELYGTNGANLKDFILQEDGGLIAESGDPWVYYPLERISDVRTIKIIIDSVSIQDTWAELSFILDDDSWEQQSFSIHNGTNIIKVNGKEGLTNVKHIRFDLVNIKGATVKLDKVSINSVDTLIMKYQVMLLFIIVCVIFANILHKSVGIKTILIKIENVFEKKKISCIILATCVFVIFITVVPSFIVARYSFFHADDFGAIRYGRSYTILEAVKAAWQGTKGSWLNWQGPYIGFLTGWIPKVFFGDGSLIGLQVVMMTITLLFVSSSFVLIHTTCRVLDVKYNYEFIIIAIYSVGVFGFNGWTEALNWHAAAGIYTVPLSLGFLGISIYLRTSRKWLYIISLVLLFFSSGGTLMVPGAICFILLGICAVKKMMNMLERKDMVAFGTAVVGALINVVAPGNYKRHATIDNSGLHLGAAIMDTISQVNSTVETLFFNTPFIIFLFAALIIGILLGKKGRKIHKNLFVVILLFSLIAPLITCFPVCLGVSSDGFANRGKFIETVIIVMSSITIAIIIGNIIEDKIETKFSLNSGMFLVMFIIIMMSICPAWKISASVPYQMWRNIAKGSYKGYYEKICNILDNILNDNNENVFVYSIPEPVQYFPSIEISENESYWINTRLAACYNKKTVQYVPNPVYIRSDGQKVVRISSQMLDTNLDYVSIYKIDSSTQNTEVIQELQPLDTNMIFNMQAGENGMIQIYAYDDALGSNQIGEKHIEY